MATTKAVGTPLFRRLIFLIKKCYIVFMEKEIIKDQSFGIIPYYKEGDKLIYLLICHKAGHWAFPKGHPEAGESIPETIQREIYEETGITKFEILPKPTFEEKYKFEKGEKILDKTVTYYLGKIAELKAEIIRTEEIIDFAWLDYDRALEKISHESCIRILKEANDFLINQV